MSARPRAACPACGTEVACVGVWRPIDPGFRGYRRGEIGRHRGDQSAVDRYGVAQCSGVGADVVLRRHLSTS